MIRKILFCGGLSLVLAIGAMAQAQPPASPANGAAMSQSGSGYATLPMGSAQVGHGYRYRVQRTDVFTLAFPLVPEFNQTVTVEPDGYIALQGIGEIYVIGDTLTELTDAIRTAYSK